jgi:hypothetical protein
MAHVQKNLMPGEMQGIMQPQLLALPNSPLGARQSSRGMIAYGLSEFNGSRQELIPRHHFSHEP